MSPAKKIRIEDLRNPVLSDFQKSALAYAETQPVQLNRKAVLEAAIQATELEDFGPEDFTCSHGSESRA